MPGFDIRTIEERDLPEVASFLQRSIAALRTPDVPHAAGVEDTTSGTNFNWLLGGNNTAFDDRIPACEIVRNASSEVVGMLCYSPRYYRLGEGRFLGLGAHNFYVDTAARMQAFILFKRYMSHRAADFCYSTTCNANSGPLWKKMGASELPNSDAEFLIPLRAGPLLEEAAIMKGLPAFVRKSCRPLGSLADVVLQPRKRRGRLKVERALDWERLAAIAETNRDPSRLTPERDVTMLRVLHERVSGLAVSSGATSGVYRFTNSSGREGWFALRERPRGRSGGIHCVVLFDLVWPRDSIEIADILNAIVEVVGRRADILSVRDFASFKHFPGGQRIRKKSLTAPEGFIASQARSGLPMRAELALITDFPEAYGA